MGKRCDKYTTGGVPGSSENQDPEFVGWLGQVAHPDSPAGGGGPGGFTRSPSPLTERHVPTSDKIPGPVQFVPADTETPKPPNPPPATQVQSLGKLKEESSDLKDVLIDAKVVADGTSKGGTQTDFTLPAMKAPAYDSDAETGMITKFKGKFTWKGTIEIKTVYGSGMSATDLSCYGRGTTDDDIRNRDITLGFHEHQHQVDFINYLKTHPLPETPEMKIGMTEDEYTTATDTFKAELATYHDAMKADSGAKTDEVGHHKSTWESTQECYLHLLP